MKLASLEGKVRLAVTEPRGLHLDGNTIDLSLKGLHKVLKLYGQSNQDLNPMHYP